jgi:hypothetical protein
MLYDKNQRLGNNKHRKDGEVIIRELKEDTSNFYLTLDISEHNKDLNKVFPVTKKSKKKFMIDDGNEQSKSDD